MKDRPGFSSQRRSVVQGCVFLTSCLAVLGALLWIPGVAAQNLDQNRTFIFHGHRVSVGLASDAAIGSSHRGLSGLTGLVPIPGGIVLPPLIHVFSPGPTSLGFQGIDVEPNVISNFRGFAARAYPVGMGTATDSEGNVIVYRESWKAWRIDQSA